MWLLFASGEVPAGWVDRRGQMDVSEIGTVEQLQGEVRVLVELLEGENELNVQRRAQLIQLRVTIERLSGVGLDALQGIRDLADPDSDRRGLDTVIENYRQEKLDIDALLRQLINSLEEDAE